MSKPGLTKTPQTLKHTFPNHEDFYAFAMGLEKDHIKTEGAVNNGYTHASYVTLIYKYGEKWGTIAIPFERLLCNHKHQKKEENKEEYTKAKISFAGDDSFLAKGLIVLNEKIQDFLSALYPKALLSGFVQTEFTNKDGAEEKMDEARIWASLQHVVGKNADKKSYRGEINVLTKNAKGEVTQTTLKSPSFIKLNSIWERSAKVSGELLVDNIMLLKKGKEVVSGLSVNAFRKLTVIPMVRQENPEDKKMAERARLDLIESDIVNEKDDKEEDVVKSDETSIFNNKEIESALNNTVDNF